MRPRFRLALIEPSLSIETLRSPWIKGGTPRYFIAGFGITMIDLSAILRCRARLRLNF